MSSCATKHTYQIGDPTLFMEEAVMPTFFDPVADAGEAAEAMRGLAHASRNFEHPQDMYGVLGDLLTSIRSLQQ